MTKRQKLELRRSQIRDRLRAISELEGDAVTDEIRAERDRLTTEYADSEGELRAAIVVEGEETERRARESGETRERRDLEHRAQLGVFVAAAAAGRDVAGAEAEFRAAVFGDDAKGYGPSGGLIVPFETVAPRARPGAPRGEDRAEDRADASTALPAAGIATVQREWVGRVFTNTAAMFLGVGFDSVEVGEQTYPVITGGVAPAPANPGAGVDAPAAEISLVNLEPHRVTGGYRFRVEDLARSGDAYESALRMDLSGAVSEAVDNQILNGTGAAPQVQGLLAALDAPDDPDNPNTTPDNIIRAISDTVEGRYARGIGDVRALLATRTYRTVASSFLANGSDVFILRHLVENTGGVQTSALLPEPDAMHIQPAIVGRTSDMRPSARAVVWPAMELIRDPYGRASAGEVRITYCVLFDFKVLRPGGFEYLKFRFGA